MPYEATSFFLLNEIAKQNDIESLYKVSSQPGEGQSADNLLPSLKKAALNWDDFVLNKAHNISDFIDVRDVVKHIRIATTRDDIIPKELKIVNISMGIGTSITILHTKNGMV